MKQINLTFLLAMLMSMGWIKAFAHNIEVVNEDGVTIYYNFINGSTELEVTRRLPVSVTARYKGKLAIPESVTYEGKTYKVTSIGDRAFDLCIDLKEVTIPSSITSVGELSVGQYPSFDLHIKDLSAWCKISFSGIEFNPLLMCTQHLYLNGVEVTKLTIPDDITAIGNVTFQGCEGLTEVTIHDNITSIGDYAFSGCSGMTKLTIGNGVTSIGQHAFHGCNGLTKLNIPNSLTTIRSFTFANCSGLTELIIPNNITTIDGRAFNNCSGLRSITIGSGVLSIGEHAFENLSRAKVIWLPNTPPRGYSLNGLRNVHYVPNELYTSLKNSTVYPFLSSMFEVDGVKYVPVSPSERTCDIIDCAYNETAENISLNKTVTNMGITLSVEQIHAYAFSGNKYIKSVKISEGFSALNEGVFSGCSSLTSISIPNDINSIGDYVFEGCSSLRDVTFEDRASELWLGSNASSPMFADCPLNRVYIGRNISYNTDSRYGYSPFYRNTTLKTVIITDVETEIGENEFYGCTSLQDVTIGDGVTTIGDWAFSGCSSIDYFEYGSAVETIGKEAFSDCTAMTRLISHAATPPTCGAQALDDINKWACTLYVPQGCAGAYQGADQWKDFFFISDDMAASIAPETIDVDTDDVKVYTIGGVGRTMKKDGLKSLPKGIYIVNGRKYIVK